MAKTALVFGATGVTGRALVQLLENNEAYEEVILFHYKPTQITGKKIKEVVANFSDIATVAFPFTKVDEVYSCIGTTIKRVGSEAAYKQIDCDYVLDLAKRMLALGATSFTLVSSAGANAQSSNYYLRIKGEVEEGLEKLPFKSLHIFRPGALYGAKRPEFRWKEVLSIPLLKLINPLLAGTWAQYKMTQVNTLAKAMVNANQKSTQGKRVFLSQQIVV